MTGFQIEALNADQDRKSFASGSEPLDRYFREFATQDAKRWISNCFVGLDGNRTVAGYYIFAASSLPISELPDDLVKRLPCYPLLPAALIGRPALIGRRMSSYATTPSLRRPFGAGAASTVFAFRPSPIFTARALRCSE